MYIYTKLQKYVIINMESIDLEKEKKVHPYEYYGKVFVEVHNNTRFLMRSALHYVIDDYDEYLGSVEQSHYEELNYNEVQILIN